MKRLVASMALFGLLLAACGTEDPPEVVDEAANGADDLGEVIIVQAVDNLVFLPTYVAVMKGFWAEQGLDARLQMVAGGPVATSAVVAGQAQAAGNSADTVFLGRRAGAEITLIANLLDQMPVDIVMNPDVLSEAGISEDEWADTPYEERSELYEGLRWAIIGPGGLTDLLVRHIITEAGFDPDTDTDILPIGGPGEIIAALRTGQVDAVLLGPPEPRMAVQEGFGVLVAHGPDVTELFESFSFEVLLVEDGWAQANPDAARALGHGIAAACTYARNTDTETLARELQENAYFLDMDFDLLVESVALVQPTVPEDCRITQGSIDTAVEFYIDAGTMEPDDLEGTEEGTFWTNEFLP